MRQLPTILLVLSLPAGIIGYAIGATLVSALMPGQTTGLVGAFVALLIAGLCMIPFLVPFLDRKAKEDLAAHLAFARTHTAEESAGHSGPSEDFALAFERRAG